MKHICVLRQMSALVALTAEGPLCLRLSQANYCTFPHRVLLLRDGWRLALVLQAPSFAFQDRWRPCCTQWAAAHAPLTCDCRVYCFREPKQCGTSDCIQLVSSEHCCMLQAPSFASHDQQRPLLPQREPTWGFSAGRLSANRNLRASRDSALSGELFLAHCLLGGGGSVPAMQHSEVTEL